jgi:pimeloyl-ACP methyl ester carboxylesterase
MYVDCRFGQLHLHTAFPSSGGFDELTPLVCVPPLTKSGRVFRPLLKDLGRDRSAYAPDLPGCGESDGVGAGTAAGAEQYALACTDLLDSLRQRHVDVIAQGEGADAAIALVKLRPGSLVRRLVFSGASPAAVAAARQLGLEFRELALATAADEARCTRSPRTTTDPPVAPRADSDPLTSTWPPTPRSRMRPPCATAVSALIAPDMLMTLSSTFFALRAVISTVRPPAVSIVPAWLIRLVTGSPFGERSWPTWVSLNARLMSESP